MNSEEFYNESIEYMRNRYDRFCEYQNTVKDIFNVFDRLCKEHGIHYCMTFGSLLGEIRDGGMVPWDPDMDVVIPFNEVHNLLAALNNFLPEDYFYVSNFTDSDFPFFEMKIGKKGFDVFRIHVDVFYAVGIPDGIDLSKYLKKIRKFHLMLFYSIESRKPIKELKKFAQSEHYAILQKVFYRVRSGCLPPKLITRMIMKLYAPNNYGSTEYLCIPDVEPSVCRYKDLEPMRREMINGREVGLPHNPEAILNSFYKDYKSYPSIEIRFNEFESFMKLYSKTMSDGESGSYYNNEV